MKKEKQRFSITGMLISIAATELVGVISALVSSGIGVTYRAYKQPPFSPPGGVFPAVWTVLYALMGISAYLIYISGDKGKDSALRSYVIQLAVNFTWSIIYFNLGLLGVSAAVIVLLIVLVFIMCFMFYRINPLAAYLNIPYILWLFFALYLNIGIFVLNR